MNISNDKLAKHVAEDNFNQALEDPQSTGYPIQHYALLVVTTSGAESGLPFIHHPNVHQITSIAKVKIGNNLAISQAVQRMTAPGAAVRNTNSDLVKSTILACLLIAPANRMPIFGSYMHWVPV